MTASEVRDVLEEPKEQGRGYWHMHYLGEPGAVVLRR